MKQILSIHLLTRYRKVKHMPEQPSSPSRARLIFDPAEFKYDFGPDHPLQGRRLISLMDLLETSGLWRSENEQTPLPSRAATIDELRLDHPADYLEPVEPLSVVDTVP